MSVKCDICKKEIEESSAKQYDDKYFCSDEHVEQYKKEKEAESNLCEFC